MNPQDPQRSPTYAAMIESMDDAVGTLLDTLDRLGIADNTIIIFTSDNGGNMYSEIDGTVPTSNSPLRGGKATMFEGGTRVPCVISWPGVVRPDTRSDALVQSEDFYPTLLESLDLKPQPEQRFDGVSILPALKGEEFSRNAVFQYFPHDPGVPDWLPASVSVHRGDWKLIRIFHGGEQGAHRYLLFNLRDDLNEQQNLAAENPDVTAELDAMIEAFLADTKAVIPIPNPAFDPAKYRPEEEGRQKLKKKPQPRAASTAATAPDNPQLQGWKARGCEATVKDGIATITGKSNTPFLGVAPGKLAAGSRLRFRIASSGGEGKVEWLPGGISNSNARPKSTPFALKAGDWAEIAADIPAEAGAGILRLYLPAQDQPVRIDWIELETAGTTRRWDF